MALLLLAGVGMRAPGPGLPPGDLLSRGAGGAPPQDSSPEVVSCVCLAGSCLPG